LSESGESKLSESESESEEESHLSESGVSGISDSYQTELDITDESSSYDDRQDIIKEIKDMGLSFIVDDSRSMVVGVIANEKLERLFKPVNVSTVFKEGAKIPFGVVTMNDIPKFELAKTLSEEETINMLNIVSDYVNIKYPIQEKALLSTVDVKLKPKNINYYVTKTDKSGNLIITKELCGCAKGYICRQGVCVLKAEKTVLFIGCGEGSEIYNKELVDKYLGGSKYVVKKMVKDTDQNIVEFVKEFAEKHKNEKFSLVYVEDCGRNFTNALYCTVFYWSHLLNYNGKVIIDGFEIDNNQCSKIDKTNRMILKSASKQKIKINKVNGVKNAAVFEIKSI